MTEPMSPGAEGIPRRTFLARAGATGLTLASSGVLAACGSVKKSGGGGGGDTLRIGLVTPRTGQASGFGEIDPYILGMVRDAVKDGTIDVIATDHAPHHYDAKEREFDDAPNGIIGLETALGLVVAAVAAFICATVSAADCDLADSMMIV